MKLRWGWGSDGGDHCRIAPISSAASARGGSRSPSVRVVCVDLRRNPNREFAKKDDRMRDEA